MTEQVWAAHAHGRCPVCGGSYSLNKDGRLRLHWPCGVNFWPIDETHAHCADEFHRCGDGGGPGEAHRYGEVEYPAHCR